MADIYFLVTLVADVLNCVVFEMAKMSLLGFVISVNQVMRTDLSFFPLAKHLNYGLLSCLPFKRSVNSN